MSAANEAWAKAQNRKAYPNGRHRFEARNGTLSPFLFAGEVVGAGEVFEGWYSEPRRHQASKPKPGQAARPPAATMKAK